MFPGGVVVAQRHGHGHPGLSRLSLSARSPRLPHIRYFVGLGGEHVRLGVTPPWPALPDVPDDLSEFEHADETPNRDEMRELFREMGVKGGVEELLDGFGYDAQGRPPGRG